MGTGGLVTIIPCLSDFDGNMQIGGINQEWIERLEKRGAETHPPAEIWGSDDKRLDQLLERPLILSLSAKAKSSTPL